ncbi:MAG: proliferating cell nuclear antigen (pcna) [Thermocladium sp.]|jgi:proliferating cell nuclear antigen
MKLVYPDAREWTSIVDAVAVLIEEATFTVAQDGLRLRALDPSRTSMVDLFIPKEAFEEYPAIDGEEHIGMNFNDLKKVLKRSRKDDKVVMEVDGGKLKVKLIGKATRTITMPLLDIGVEQLPAPKAVFTVMAKLASDALDQAIRDVEIIADAVKLEGKEDGIYVKASSDKGDLEIKFEREGDVMFEYDLKESAASTYSIDYLADITSKAASISDIVTLEFATQKPIALTFEIPMGGKLAYYIAPRMD